MCESHSINIPAHIHVGIRSLQCILLKLCLLLGVKIYSGIEFLEILEPNEQIGWHASVDPEDHPVSEFEFDFIVGKLHCTITVEICCIMYIACNGYVHSV